MTEGRDVGTGASLTASERVQRLQTALHAKAKGAPSFRFYSLSDKVWRDDVLVVAWQTVRRNGGAAGVDGETVADVESQGVDRWLGALARDLKAGTYRPRAVRQVLIPKKQRGKFRPLGIPCLRDRVAQTAAMLVLSPIFEADLQPEQYAYRPGRDANDAVRRVHRLLTTGHREVVDADLSDYFGQIPHAELLRSIARRASDGRLLGWVKAWLEMAVEEDDGRGGRRRTNRARRERKGTPQGSPISPLFSNIYMRRFILGWKALGYARRFEAEIVNYADDFAVLGRAPAAEMLTAVEGLMRRLKLPMNAEKTRCCRVPEEPMTFLGYRIGRNHRPTTGAAYIGTRPSRESIQSICRRVSELTTRRDALLPPGDVVARLNRLLTGWANYFTLGQVSPAYRAVDKHATRRLRQWLCRKHKVRAGKLVRFPAERLWTEYGLARLATRTGSFPWAKA
ncbi:MAG: group II intron reverse transcriptase/maturase [Gemmatimonadota bacterium]|nr:group II intron reverse transcriptase/maturase [Gemmatimonadota bacterium]